MQMSEPASFSPSSSSNGATVTPRTKPNGINGHVSKFVNSSTSSFKVNDNGANSAAKEVEETEVESLEKLLLVSVIVLRQAVDLVNESLSEDDQLTQVSMYIPGSTIGKHLRHATDHFSLLLDSLSNTNSELELGQGQRDVELELSYDARARGTPMESSRAAACATLEGCIARLQHAVPKAERDKPVRLKAVTPYVQTFRTSFGRELWFAVLHAVHHWSMVRVIAGELGIQLEDSFGVAPSTLVHRGSEGPLGKAKI